MNYCYCCCCCYCGPKRRSLTKTTIVPHYHRKQPSPPPLQQHSVGWPKLSAEDAARHEPPVEADNSSSKLAPLAAAAAAENDDYYCFDSRWARRRCESDRRFPVRPKTGALRKKSMSAPSIVSTRNSVCPQQRPTRTAPCGRRSSRQLGPT